MLRGPATILLALAIAGCSTDTDERTSVPPHPSSSTATNSPDSEPATWGPLAVVRTEGKEGVLWPDIGFLPGAAPVHIEKNCVMLGKRGEQVLLVFIDVMTEYVDGKIILRPDIPRKGPSATGRRVILSDGDRIEVAATVSPRLLPTVDWLNPPDPRCGSRAEFVYDARVVG